MGKRRKDRIKSKKSRFVKMHKNGQFSSSMISKLEKMDEPTFLENLVL